MLQQNSLKCGRILQRFQDSDTQPGNMFQTACFQVQVFLFNCISQWCCLCLISDNLYSHISRDGRSVTILTSTGFFFSIEWFLYQCVSQIHWGVQSVSDLVPDPLLYLEKIHFCQEEHKKEKVLSGDWQLWLFLQTRTYISFSSVAQQEVMS